MGPAHSSIRARLGARVLSMPLTSQDRKKPEANSDPNVGWGPPTVLSAPGLVPGCFLCLLLAKTAKNLKPTQIQMWEGACPPTVMSAPSLMPGCFLCLLLAKTAKNLKPTQIQMWEGACRPTVLSAPGLVPGCFLCLLLAKTAQKPEANSDPNVGCGLPSHSFVRARLGARVLFYAIC
jgi:hypothetical protein